MLGDVASGSHWHMNSATFLWLGMPEQSSARLTSILNYGLTISVARKKLSFSLPAYWSQIPGSVKYWFGVAMT